MNQGIEELENKIALVSAENKTLKEQFNSLKKSITVVRISLVWLSLLILLPSYFFFSQKTFSGRWFSIDDKEKKIRAWWDEDGLEMKDKAGVVRAKLSVSPGGSPYFQMFDEKHQLRGQLFVYPDGSGYLMLWDKDGKGVRFPPSKTPLP